MKNIIEKIEKNPLLFILSGLAIHFIIRMLFSETIQVDDREQVYFGQFLNLGYQMPQPPLYSWLSWLFFYFFGSNLLALSIIKYLLISLTFYFIFKIANKIFESKLLIATTLASFLLMPSFFWHMHQGFTHTVLLGLGIVATLYYLFKLSEFQSWKNYLLFGVCISIGLLSKYSYIIYFLILVLTILVNRNYRDLVFNRKIFISLGIIFILSSPHYLWLLDNFNSISTEAKSRLLIDEINVIHLENFSKILKAYIGFLSPLILFFIPFIFKRDRKESNDKSQNHIYFFRNFFIIVLILSIIFGSFYEIEKIKIRWLHPLLMISPFWLLLELKVFKFANRKFFSFIIKGAIFLTILVYSIRVAQMTIGPNLGFYGRLNVPISTTLRKIPNEFLKNSVIFTKDFDIFSHLFNVFPFNPVIYDGKTFNQQKNVIFRNCLIISTNEIPFGDNEIKRGKATSKVADREYNIHYSLKNDSKCILN